MTSHDAHEQRGEVSSPSTNRYPAKSGGVAASLESPFDRAVLETTVPMMSAVTIRRRILTAFAASAVVGLAAVAIVPPAAGAGTSSAKALAKDLLPSSYARGIGFTKVAEKATTSSKTGVTSCPRGAEAAFEDGSNQTGMISEVLQCRTKAAATKILSSVVANTSASSSPPRRLGSSAIERSGSGPIYTIYWRRGTDVEIVALETRLSSSSSSSSTTTTTVPAPPITADQQKILADAAMKQDALLN